MAIFGKWPFKEVKDWDILMKPYLNYLRMDLSTPNGRKKMSVMSWIYNSMECNMSRSIHYCKDLWYSNHSSYVQNEIMLGFTLDKGPCQFKARRYILRGLLCLTYMDWENSLRYKNLFLLDKRKLLKIGTSTNYWVVLIQNMQQFKNKF